MVRMILVARKGASIEEKWRASRIKRKGDEYLTEKCSLAKPIPSG
jgi:hypothetical protein